VLQKLSKTKWIYLITICYVIWSAVFIYLTSYVAIDGNRYFSLFDDAMISMRYAWNFAHGNGLVWNAGEYIEGYTNLLQTLHMALWSGFLDKSTAVLMIQIIGISIMLGISYFTMKITSFVFELESLKHRGFYSVLVYALCLMYYPLSYWTLLGMETGLLTILLLGALFLIFRGICDDTKKSKLIPFLIGLAFLARPDSLIPATIILTVKWFYEFKFRHDNKFITQALYDVAIIMGIILLVTLFRVLYYGNIVPNTYTLKVVGMPLVDRISNGSIFISRFIILIIFPLITIISYLLIRKSIYPILLLMSFLSTIIYQIWVGGDPWPYWRIITPTIPIFIVLCLASLNYFLTLLESRYQIWKSGSICHQRVAFILMMIFIIGFNYPFYKNILFYDYPANVDLSWSLIDTTVALNDITDPNATIAVTAAGTLPYYVDLKAIDMLGKSDAYIASLQPNLNGQPSWMGMSSMPGHNKYDLNYSIIELQPTYTSRLKWGSNDVTSLATNYNVFTYNDKTLLILNTESPYVNWDKVVKTDIELDDTRAYR